MKKIFGKGGIIDNETRRWDKAADQATRKLDKDTGQALGMPEGTSFGNLFKPDSDPEKHKAAVKWAQGKDTTSSAPVSAEERKDPEGKGEDTVSTPAPVTQAQVPTLEASAPSATPEPPTSTTTNVSDDKVVVKKVESSPSEVVASSNVSSTEKTADKESSTSTTKETDEKALKASESGASSSSQSKAYVWARTLLDHKELTKTDKQALPHFFKTEEEVTNLTNEIFRLASTESDSSYITVSTDLVADINDLYSGGYVS